MGTAASASKKNKTQMSGGGKSLYIRRAHHAGSWYSDDQAELDQTLTEYLTAASQDGNSSSNSSSNHLRGIICPHAGYSYSGPTAAYSYLALQQELSQPNTPVRTILVLHPSHHYYMEDGCAVSGASEIATPLGNLPVDDALRQELLQLQLGSSSSSPFSIMTQAVDEAEHSGEMQYPYLAKVIAAGNNNNNNNKKAIQVLPIMCGNLSVPKEAFYGNLLAEIIARPQVLCVVSTDFCHWGRRFSYQPTATTSSDNDDDSGNNNMEIHEFIQRLDNKGMEHIELQQPGAFAEYLKQTRNTICGRHAVQVWLHAVQKNNAEREDPVQIQFVKYAQSSPAKTLRDSSVSYASAVARSQR